MSLLEAFLRNELWPNSVTALDLFGIGDLLAGELAGEGLEADELTAKVRGVGVRR